MKRKTEYERMTPAERREFHIYAILAAVVLALLAAAPMLLERVL